MVTPVPLRHNAPGYVLCISPFALARDFSVDARSQDGGWEAFHLGPGSLKERGHDHPVRDVASIQRDMIQSG